ncbi:hypothetical protein [Georgenia sp. AZ-5]|uniref:hypothetical protein n=1 Tax=Georgenia sp. AZ-5 TaxID=3367526 RepID=UPI00375487AD
MADTRRTPPAGTRPAGPVRRRPSRATIIRRRIVALLILLAVAALVVWGVSAAVRALVGDREIAVAEATPTPTGPTDPGPCEPRDLEADLTPAASGTGQPVTFTLTLTNDGAAACLTDAGRGSLVVTVRSGSDRVWSSADCVGEAAPRELLLDTGDSTETKLTWNGSRSAAGCAGGQGAAREGTYRAEATLDGASLQGADATFSLG